MCPIEGFEKCGKSIRSGDTKEVDTIDEEVHAITMEVDNITKVVDAITKEVFTIFSSWSSESLIFPNI